MIIRAGYKKISKFNSTHNFPTSRVVRATFEKGGACFGWGRERSEQKPYPGLPKVIGKTFHYCHLVLCSPNLQFNSQSSASIGNAFVFLSSIQMDQVL